MCLGDLRKEVTRACLKSPSLTLHSAIKQYYVIRCMGCKAIKKKINKINNK